MRGPPVSYPNPFTSSPESMEVPDRCMPKTMNPGVFNPPSAPFFDSRASPPSAGMTTSFASGRTSSLSQVSSASFQ